MHTLPHIMSNRRRQWVAWLYQWLTKHQRNQTRQELIKSGRFPIAILFYHRVADCLPTPWTISRRDFVRHLDWLQENFDIVSLSEAQARIRSTSNSRPTVSLSFDDGYAENCDFAIPELIRRRLPATYFVVSQSVAEGRSFPHDAIEDLNIAPNNIDQIRAMHREGIEIAAHTRTHRDLGQISCGTELAEETLGSIREIESWGIGPVRYFSFPFGMPANTSQAAVDILLRSGIQGFCTAYGAWNWPGSCGNHLRRIHADPGIQTLKNWLTLDLRKFTDHHHLPFKEVPSTEAATKEIVADASGVYAVV